MKIAIVALISVLTPFLNGAPLIATDLRTNLRTNPAGVGTNPTLSWKLVSDERGKRQSAYQILAASSPEKLSDGAADFWNSEKTETGRKMFVPWMGPKLTDTASVHWKVRVWDEEDQAGPWSEVASFQVDGDPDLPKPSRTSNFESSSPALNGLYEKSLAELEKRLTAFAEGDPKALGRGDQVHRSARAMLYHFDAAVHLAEWLRLMDASLTEDKTFPVAPGSSTVGSVASEAAIIVDHPLWWMSGGVRLPGERWKHYEDHMVFREKNDLGFKGTAWGEAEGSEGMSAEFIDLAYLGFTSRLIRELSGPAEQPLNVIRFQDYASRIRNNFGRHYVKDDGSLKASSQSAHVLALRSAVLTSEQQEKVIADLMASLKKDGVDVGPIGAYFLPSVLTLTGHQDEAVDLLKNLTPGQQEVFAGNGVSEWLMAYLAGIDAAFPGFRQVRIAPKIPSDDSVTWVKARLESPVGPISVHWEKLASGGLKVEVSIPAGVPIARIELPAPKGATITEGGKKLSEATAVELVEQSDELISLVSQSGTYSFLIK